MTAQRLYRVAFGLLLLMTAGHTFGFHQVDPEWGLGALVGTMQSQQFTVQGFTRTYWDFFLGSGFTVSVLYLFAAILAWHLGSLPDAMLRSMRSVGWSFAACFGAISVVSFRYVFWIPVVLSALVAVSLGVAAWSSGKPASETQPLGKP